MAKEHMAVTPEDLDRIEGELRETRKSLRTSITELRQSLRVAAESSRSEIKDELSVQKQVTRNPWPWMAGAFSVGLAASAIVMGRSKNHPLHGMLERGANQLPGLIGGLATTAIAKLSADFFQHFFKQGEKSSGYRSGGRSPDHDGYDNEDFLH